MQYITDADNEAVGPIFAEFSTDAYLKTKAGDYDYLKSVPDPISYDPAILNIITATGAHQRGMSQNGTNRWAHGNSSHLGTGTDWSVRWDEAAQILTHYYTGIHLRDAANNDQQLTPDYRWNLLDVSWAEAGCPDIIPENGVCTGTFLIQNTGVTAWNSGRIFFDHYTLTKQANRTTGALFHPTSINTAAQPGGVVTVTVAISPPAGAVAGSRHTIRFDMAYDENETVNYFSDREAGRPWYTYDIESCVGYCATYLPLVLKNYVPPFVETFNPRNPNWHLVGGDTNPNGRTDTGALELDKAERADITIGVLVNSEPTISFWCKDIVDGASTWPRIDLYLDGEDVTPGFGANNIPCGKSWTYYEYIIDNSVNDGNKYGNTSDGQVLIDFHAGSDQIRDTKILLDDITVEMK